jgi:hypothetical protein
MCVYQKKTRIFLDKKMYFPTVLLLLVYIMGGCNATSSMESYENTEAGISLEKPENWELSYIERNGMIVLTTENGIWNRDSVRIEIQGPACLSVPANSSSPDEELERNIDRIRKLYNLESVTVVQEPTKSKTGDYEVTKSIIMIPSMALPQDSSRNQVGERGPDIFQIIDISAITHKGYTVMTYIYKGNSETLNTQAQTIIDSIQFTCVAEP